MSAEAFDFVPAIVPEATRGLKKSKYTATVEAIYLFLQEHKDTKAVKIELGDVSLKSALTSFRNTVRRLYPDTLRVVQRGGDLYIEHVERRS